MSKLIHTIIDGNVSRPLRMLCIVDTFFAWNFHVPPISLGVDLLPSNVVRKVAQLQLKFGHSTWADVGSHCMKQGWLCE